MADSDELERSKRELWDAVNWDFGGFASPDQVQKVQRMANLIAADAGSGYAREKAAKLIHWVEIAYSSRKHVRWGIDRVRDFARGEAYTLTHLVDEMPRGL